MPIRAHTHAYPPTTYACTCLHTFVRPLPPVRAPAYSRAYTRTVEADACSRTCLRLPCATCALHHVDNHAHLSAPKWCPYRQFHMRVCPLPPGTPPVLVPIPDPPVFVSGRPHTASVHLPTHRYPQPACVVMYTLITVRLLHCAAFTAAPTLLRRYYSRAYRNAPPSQPRLP